VLTVVVKATYAIQPVESALAREQEYPNEDDNHWNDDDARSLYSPSDLVPFKPRADVMLVGHAFAPRKEPVRSLVARLVVGEVNKAVEVFGERAWTHDGMLREGPRFVKMPLRYERASGGLDTANPVGMPPEGREDSFGNVPIPNLQPPGMLLAAPGEFIEPTGFGPIAPRWPARAEKLGRHAATWQQGAWDQPVPEDIDPGYFMAGPRDQQVEQLRPNERIVLENLHPDHARLVTSLPGLAPQAFVERRGAAQHELSLTCDTLWIDTDRSICTATWRGQLPLDHPQQPGRVLIGLAEPGKRLSWADVERLASRGDSSEDTGHRRIPRTAEVSALNEGAPAAVRGNPTLPFIATEGLLPGPKFGAPPSPNKKPGKPPKPDKEEGSSTADEEFTNTGFVRPAMSALPFANEPTSSGAPFASDPVRSAAYGDGAGLPFGADAGPRFPPAPPTSRVAGTDAPPPAADASPAWLAPAPPRAPSGLLDVVPQPPPRPASTATPGALFPPALGAPPPSSDAAFPPARASSPGESPWAGPNGAPSFSAGARGDLPPIGFGTPPAVSGFGGPPPVPPPQVVPPPSPSNASNAAAGGVVAASNAAAGANAWGSAPTPPPPAPAPPIMPRSVARPTAREVVELLWYEPTALDRFRAYSAWKPALIEAKPPPPEVVPFDAELPPDPTPEQLERRDVVAILTRIEPHDEQGINEAIADGVTEEGLFEPPFILLNGELTLPFDELETLKANVTAVTPLIAGDKKLKETVDTVNELLKTPWLQSSTGVAEGLTQRVREAFAQANRILPASYLETHTERMLLEQRHYQKRTMWGEPWIRSLLVPANGSTPIPAYLPEALSKHLPMFQRFKARVIAEALLQQDENEAQPIALKVLTLGRCVQLSGVAQRRRGAPKLVG
jgi:hypothetical protein